MGMIGKPVRTHEIPEPQPFYIPKPIVAPIQAPVQIPAEKEVEV
jgi:hypothetical protein